jgi:hypothetical protein
VSSLLLAVPVPYLSHRVTHLASLSLFRVTLNPKPSHTTTDHGCSIFPY